MIKKIPTKDMTHDDWLEARKNTIGGSEAAALCGMNQYMSPYSVWAEKMGLVSSAQDNEAMRQGRDLEQYVADRFSEATGKKVRKDNNIITNTDYPFAHANIDRIVIGEDAGLECKTTSVMNLKKFNNGEYPDNYYVQCMHYMMVTGKKKWYLAVLVLGTAFMWFEIERDESEIFRLAQIEENFYQHIKDGTPPAPDGSKATSDTLALIYADSDESKECDLMLYKSEIDEYMSIKSQISALEKLRNEKANIIKDAMKNAETGICGENKITWITQNRGTLNKKALVTDYPDINLEDYTRYTKSRVFKIS